MKVGYVRVSTIEQNEGRQVKDLQEHAGVEKVFLDKLSGKDTNRPQFKAMLDFVREGDEIFVSEYSRLARSTADLLNIIDELDNKGIKLVSMKEKLDTSTPQGRLMITVFAGLAQFERELMLQRQREGIALAKAEGKYKGRAKAVRPENWKELVSLYQSRRMTATELAKRCEVSRPIVYKWLKEDETTTA
jgi:DNA invertase Pin-like site-specific DNA recombinase